MKNEKDNIVLDKDKNACNNILLDTKLRLKTFIELRSKVSMYLLALIIVLYYGFILMIGFFPKVLGYAVGPTSISVGIAFGIFIIISAIMVTGLYAFVANNYFDKELNSIIKDIKKHELSKELIKDIG